MNKIISKNLYLKKEGKTILNDLNFEFTQGKIIAVLGENSAGKTTLLNTIAGLKIVTTGLLTINNEKIGPKTKEIVSLSMDSYTFSKTSKVKHVLKFYRSFFHDYSQQREKELLLLMNINPEERINTLSKGQRACLSIVITLSRKALFYLLDEPFEGIDLITREKIIKALIQWIDEDCSIILTTHNIREVENILDEIMILKNGELLLHEEVGTLHEKYDMKLENIYRKVIIP